MDKQERDALVVRLYRYGKNIAEVSREVGINKVTVSKILARHGVPIRPGR